MPIWIELFMPVVTVLGVVSLEISCLRRGIPNRHRAMACTAALGTWSLYYASVTLIEIGRRSLELSIAAAGLSIAFASLTHSAHRRVCREPELEPLETGAPLAASA